MHRGVMSPAGTKRWLIGCSVSCLWARYDNF